MGEPKATDIPEAAAAERTSRLRASLSLMLLNSLMNRLAQQHATWTRGPSLPSHMPDETARISPKDLVIKVHRPRNRRMTKPPSTVLISGIPLCFA